METNNETIVPAHYNPNQLVTFKVVDLDATENIISYPTVKVTDIEWDLEQSRRTSKRLSEYSDKVTQLENRLSEYLEMDSEDIVADICSIFGFNPTKEVEFEASVTVNGTVQIPLSEYKDFDIDNLNLYVSVDSYEYDINADAEVDNITTL